MPGLPILEEIIYYLEDLRKNEKYYINWQQSRLEEIPQARLHAAPELLGTQIFPLPSWSSEQGYQLMQKFAMQLRSSTAKASKAKAFGDEEVLQILRSRHQVFKRFRKYLKDHPDTKREWKRFKTQEFVRYLSSWYANEYPQAEYLQNAFDKLAADSVEAEEQKLLREPTAVLELGFLDEELDGADNLLHEDFELRDCNRETATEFLALSEYVRDLRGLALLQSLALLAGTTRAASYFPNGGEAREEADKEVREVVALRICQYKQAWESIDWVNQFRAEAVSGDLAAIIFWAWRSKGEIQVLQLLCWPEYRKLNLEQYMFECFLQSYAPRLGIQKVVLCGDDEQKEQVSGLLRNWPTEELLQFHCLSLRDL